MCVRLYVYMRIHRNAFRNVVLDPNDWTVQDSRETEAIAVTPTYQNRWIYSYLEAFLSQESKKTRSRPKYQHSQHRQGLPLRFSFFFFAIWAYYGILI